MHGAGLEGLEVIHKILCPRIKERRIGIKEVDAEEFLHVVTAKGVVVNPIFAAKIANPTRS